MDPIAASAHIPIGDAPETSQPKPPPSMLPSLGKMPASVGRMVMMPASVFDEVPASSWLLPASAVKIGVPLSAVVVPPSGAPASLTTVFVPHLPSVRQLPVRHTVAAFAVVQLPVPSA